MTPARRANKQKYRLDEGRSIQVWFEGQWHQVLAVARTHWSNPDGGKNVRFEVATYGIGRRVVDLLNGHEHRAVVRLVRRLKNTKGHSRASLCQPAYQLACDDILRALAKRKGG